MGVVPGRVSSVTLAVRDLAAADRFYTEVFGFERVSGNEILTRFRLENLHLDLIQAEILEAETGVERMPAMPGPITLAIAANDYGFELLGPPEVEFEPWLTDELFSTSSLTADVVESLNLSELARLQFREVARVSGLIQQNYPGAAKTGRQVQVSAGLLFDVFSEFEPQNLLLQQARREVLERHFEQSRLARTLARVRNGPRRIVRTKRPTPLSFPLIVERQAAKLSTESIAQRVERMMSQWEQPPSPSTSQASTSP